jgi:hypothetical protein
MDLQQKLPCENGHSFELQRGLVENRYTGELLIHCPECGISVGVFPSSYPRESLPKDLPLWPAEE